MSNQSNILKLQHDNSGRETYSGKYVSLQHSLNMYMRPITKRNNGSPDFEVLTKNINGDYLTIGNAWAKETRVSRDRFLSITVDDPSFDRPLNLMAFKNKNDSDLFDIVWSRPKKMNKKDSTVDNKNDTNDNIPY